MRERDVTVDEVEYSKSGLSEQAVKDIVAKAGGVAAVLNARHVIAKEKAWATKPPSASVFAKAVVADVNLLRRPILIDGEEIVVGFDREAYGKLR